MKSSLIKIENLPSDVVSQHTIRLKPLGLLIFGFLFGIFCYVINSPVSELGLFIAVLCVFLFMMLPDRILIQFCEKYLLLYSKEDNGQVRMLYYDEIIKYQYISASSADTLTFTLEDGSSYSIEIYGKKKMEKLLEEKLPFKAVK